MRLPELLDGLIRGLLPEAFAEEVVGDLREGYSRRARRNRLAAALWWLREVLTLRPVALWRQARRLRRRGVRPELSPVTAGSGLWAKEFRIAVRSLWRRPTQSAVGVLTLVASVGAATLVFSVLEGVLLRPLPYPSGERLYEVWGTSAAAQQSDNSVLREAWNRRPISQAMLAAWRKSAPAVESVAGYLGTKVRWDDGAAPVEVAGAWVLPGFFATLGLRPVVGSVPGDATLASGGDVVVLSERFWASRYGRDPGVLGRTVRLDGRVVTVVGVMPAALVLPSGELDWWMPLPAALAAQRDLTIFRGVLRLRSGIRATVARQQLAVATEGLAGSNPVYRGMGARLVPLRDEIVAPVREGLTYSFWTVVLVTLIACVNLTSLVVARGARRRPELAMRAALGASRASLVGAMLTETVVICLVGGSLGLLASALSIHPLVRFLMSAVPGFPRADNVGINLPVLAFTLALTVGTALLAGAVPAWVVSKRSPWEALREGPRSRGGRGVRRIQRGLLFLDAMMAVALLAAAGLLTRSSLYASAVDAGFDRAVAFLAIRPSQERDSTGAEAQATGARVAERIGALPGVAVVGRASALPSMGSSQLNLVWLTGQPPASGTPIPTVAVDSGYFAALRIPIVAGRSFQAGDGPDVEPVVVVSQSLGRKLFGGENPLGRTIMLGKDTRLEGGQLAAAEGEAARIVGVARDVRELAVILDPDPLLYRPLAQTSTRDQVIVARGSGPTAALATAARRQALAADPDLLVSDAGVLARAVLRPLAGVKLRTALALVLAGLAVLLTLVGIHGVVAYVVSDRAHEIGVRMALGALPLGESVRMVGVALWPVLLGGLVGLAAAGGLSGILREILFGVSQTDPLTYGAVLLLLVGMAALSAWVPARRAAAVDPVRILNRD